MSDLTEYLMMIESMPADQIREAYNFALDMVSVAETKLDYWSSMNENNITKPMIEFYSQEVKTRVAILNDLTPSYRKHFAT